MMPSLNDADSDIAHVEVSALVSLEDVPHCNDSSILPERAEAASFQDP